MDKEEADLKLRLIEVLLIIAGILVGMKQISLNMSISIIFFLFAILYFIQVSDYKNKKSLSHFIVFFVAVSFSVTLGAAMGISTQGDSLGLIVMMFVFTILLFMVLSERSFMTKKITELKKLISKVFQFNNMKKKAPKRNISASDILTGAGIGIAYIFFGIHEVGSEFVRFWSGYIAIGGGILILLLIIYHIVKSRKHYFSIR